MKTLKIFSLTAALFLLLSPLISGQQRVVDVGKEETSPLSGLFFVLGVSLIRSPDMYGW